MIMLIAQARIISLTDIAEAVSKHFARQPLIDPKY
jgi:hypothetical protein